MISTMNLPPPLTLYAMRSGQLTCALTQVRCINEGKALREELDAYKPAANKRERQ